MSRDGAPVVVLGAGVAGLATAWKLATLGRVPILVLERGAEPGGLAATTAFCGFRLDLGSHRIHPDYYPDALALLRELLGDELLRVPRRGRLRFNGCYIDYPPSLIGFLAALGPREIARCAAALVRARLDARPPRRGERASYEDHLLPRVGRRAYELFYAPYARKVFGLDPRQIHARAAKTRISTSRPWTLAVQFARRGLARGRDPDRFFHYPARGFGSIGEALVHAVRRAGVALHTGATVRQLRAAGDHIAGVAYEHGGQVHDVAVAAVVSTVPLATLTGLVDPPAPPAVRAAADGLRWRGIRLLQLVLDQPRCLDGETYYFPEERYCFGRISEPALFSPALGDGSGRTALNVEVIASPGDAVWEMAEDDFLARVAADAEAIGLFDPRRVVAARSLRLPAVYPVYDLDHAERLDAVLRWVQRHDNLYSIGRGGMFLHANTDHSLHLGLRLADHLASPGPRNAWDAALPEGVTVRD